MRMGWDGRWWGAGVVCRQPPTANRQPPARTAAFSAHRHAYHPRIMTKLLLILVLFGPSDRTVGDRISAQLAALGGAGVKVLAGADAAKALESRGVKDVDLVSSPTLGEQ